MKIIMPSVILIGMSNIIGLQLLVPDGREKDVVIAAVIGAAADLVLNLVLIPRFASAGAAAATLAAE
ncbi:MAG: flippase, partial [Clostridiales bacterium]|nr:flippase [Clostridiales bacterium]